MLLGISLLLTLLDNGLLLGYIIGINLHAVELLMHCTIYILKLAGYWMLLTLLGIGLLLTLLGNGLLLDIGLYAC